MAKPVPLTPEKKITDDPMIVADPEPVAGAMDDLDLEGMPDPLHSDRWTIQTKHCTDITC